MTPTELFGLLVHSLRGIKLCQAETFLMCPTPQVCRCRWGMRIMDTINRKLARDFMKRSEELGYFGDKRYFAAMDFWTGAAVALAHIGRQDLANEVAKFGVLAIRTQGFAAV